MIENTILFSLINNEDFARKTLPYIHSEYFHNQSERIVFDVIKNYISKYNTSPNIQAVKIDLLNHKDLNEHLAKECQSIVDAYTKEEFKLDWLINNTEAFCKDKAIMNGIYKSIGILEKKEKGVVERGAIPQILSDALAVSFDTHIGHDYTEDWEGRYDYFHSKEEKIPFDIEILNKITKGGVKRKTLNILMGGVGFGKSLLMCHMAAANLSGGNNVLYITLEMSEEEISNRIDANLMDIKLDDLEILPKSIFEKKIAAIRVKTPGKLIVKEYSSACAGADNFRHLINELELKKKFKPDIIYVDYLNICKSSRIKYTANVGLYEYVQAIAQEIRGLAQEKCLPIISATQLNRAGFAESDPGMEHISESFGLAAQADLILILVTNDELTAMNQIFVKQVKNRYNRLDYYQRFHVGCDRSRMRLFDIKNEENVLPKKIEEKKRGPKKKQESHVPEDSPVFDKTTSGTKIDREKFKDFK